MNLPQRQGRMFGEPIARVSRAEGVVEPFEFQECCALKNACRFPVRVPGYRPFQKYVSQDSPAHRTAGSPGLP